MIGSGIGLSEVIGLGIRLMIGLGIRLSEVIGLGIGLIVRGRVG